ncbi:hypothetical protein M427DRAFT_357561 [Gonapodya prolifera JEL478]|uniref:Uncharacterized protein n=1 Tax=Gonapodya prolifera (strain JEL478) TaxID=1344416 RepID=A0A139AAV8_GONPJ|nr:hypothetical protein M427DRAFT_357561 [Gonapodya prolifera JEL478]|eukprot:KXS13804.1 hypothetical protein M427DRAFT_357561 [Gonapodya prolifera JEL478]
MVTLPVAASLRPSSATTHHCHFPPSSFQSTLASRRSTCICVDPPRAETCTDVGTDVPGPGLFPFLEKPSSRNEPNNCRSHCSRSPRTHDEPKRDTNRAIATQKRRHLAWITTPAPAAQSANQRKRA